MQLIVVLLFPSNLFLFIFWRLKELCSTKDTAAGNEQRLGAELSTVWFYLS